MQMYDIVATGVLGLLVGFWSGRSIRWKMEETEETGEDREERKNTAARQLVREGVTIGSPVNGEIRKRMEETAEETADAGTGCISIVPEDGKVYAPTAGKVLKLYPMGNRIRFRTDSGLELLLNICRDREELHSAYYHCNVLQNEIVRKGKLLMEFDQEGLEREGVDTAVTVEMCRSRSGDRSSVPGKIISGRERNFCGYSVREGIGRFFLPAVSSGSGVISGMKGPEKGAGASESHIQRNLRHGELRGQ